MDRSLGRGEPPRPPAVQGGRTTTTTAPPLSPEARMKARGKWIRTLRKDLGITQRQLADLLDTAGNEVSYYESGRRDPSPPRRRMLQFIQQALRHHPRAVVYREGDYTTDERWAHIMRAAVNPPAEPFEGVAA